MTESLPSSKGQRLYDYDPMIYDLLREAANVLRGEYIGLANESAEPERSRFLKAERAVSREVDAVDSYDRAAVESLTAEFRGRTSELRSI
ncbi:hypothetical protein [Microbacterium amylolyticum]|uniref:Uncharacterized protein n=1 Tax=Microbacterium amylolyticum TaxID=936337 RepID=A0ABS4ZN61_9MICO|nr:hypothetical protein [Microbacterium amylolyticum]MBP2436938.1 hypothetical protein [Microbacterium amylolyticum]MBP2437881.1 hypothetical protein [Microbacterium amylolyticum]